MMGEKGKRVKYATKVVDVDKHVFEVYDLTLNKEKPIMQITHTRNNRE